MSQREQFLWVEKYRPKTIDDCILPASHKSIFAGIVKEGRLPNLLLSGTPGQGKTTVAKALCNQLDADYIMINGSDERTMDVFRDRIKAFATSFSLMGTKKAVIIDEADYLTPDFQAAMRSLMEECAHNCSFILTCNLKNRIIEALHSRCSLVEFRISKDDKKKIFEEEYKRIAYILKQENVKFTPEVVAEVMKRFFPDYRRTINELQKYSKINNEINEGVLAQSYELDMSLLFKAMKEKNFTQVREWVVSNIENDPARIYRKLYDGLKLIMEPSSIPQSIVTIANYQYKNSFSADSEICLLACLIEIMIEATWLEK